jgi:hypothetical protein
MLEKPVSRRGFLGLATCLGAASMLIFATPNKAAYAAKKAVIAAVTPELAAYSGTTQDASAAITAYLAKSTGLSTISGDFFLDAEVEVPYNVTQLELAAGTKLKVRGDHGALSRSGTIIYREMTPTAMVKGKPSITVKTASKYKANEYILVSGDDTIPDAADRYGYLRRVVSINGTTVNMDKSLPRTIQIKPRTSAVALAPSLKIFGSGEVYNIDPANSTSTLISFFATDNPQVKGIDVHHNGATGIVVSHCKGGTIDCTIHDLLDDGEIYFGYGVNVTGSTRQLTVKGTISRVRHAVTTNSGGHITNVGGAGEPEDCRFEPIAIDCSDKSVDTHRLGWNTVIVPHITGGRGGVQVRADNTRVLGGEITGSNGPGISIWPVIGVAATVDSTIISNLKPTGVAVQADGPLIMTNIDIRDCIGGNIVLASNSTVTGGSIRAGDSVGVKFNGSNNTVEGLQLGTNITKPYVEAPGATNNVFNASTTQPSDLPAPKTLVEPVIVGPMMVGEQLTIDDGTWDVGPLTYFFTWMRNGVPLSNATNRTYRTYDVVSGDLGAVLTVKVVVKRAGYADGAATTAGTVPIKPGSALTPTTQPVLSGTAKPGSTLTVTRGTWDPAAKNTSCTWLANGVPNGSTGTTYLVKNSDLGKKISVTVKATRTGWADGSYTTPAKTIA